MREWALVRNGYIVNVVTTSKSRREVEQSYPGYQVKDLYAECSRSMQESYQYWNERP